MTLSNEFKIHADHCRQNATGNREVLASRATSDYTPQGLLAHVYAIAAYEEQARIYTTASHIPAENFAKWLQEISLTSPDDAWSGRGNDLKRVVHDARQEALRSISLQTGLRR